MEHNKDEEIELDDLGEKKGDQMGVAVPLQSREPTTGCVISFVYFICCDLYFCCQTRRAVFVFILLFIHSKHVPPGICRLP